MSTSVGKDVASNIGPVHVVSDSVYAADGRLVADSGFADFGHRPLTLPEREAVARRIAATLNATRDLPVEVLEFIGNLRRDAVRLAALNVSARAVLEERTADIEGDALSDLERQCDNAGLMLGDVFAGIDGRQLPPDDGNSEIPERCLQL